MSWDMPEAVIVAVRQGTKKKEPLEPKSTDTPSADKGCPSTRSKREDGPCNKKNKETVTG